LNRPDRCTFHVKHGQPETSPECPESGISQKIVLHFQVKAVNEDCAPRNTLRDVSAIGGKNYGN
jgi:hypothetical protein